MSGLPEKISECIRHRRLIDPGRSVLVGVSGGVDSMVLLHILKALSDDRSWHLTVAHLNHCLRGRSSDADERLVLRTAAALGVEAVTARVDVKALAGQGKLSLEMAARQARHEFLARVAVEHNIPLVALAHHADDQQELFFLRLLRGSGGEGLSGMRWTSPSPANPAVRLVRPLLECSKADVENYARATRVPFRKDRTNDSIDFLRNRIRHELLPLLKAYQPGLDQVLPRVMEIVGAEADLAREMARDWVQAQSAKPRNHVSGMPHLRAIPFEKLPLAVQRRCLRQQLLALGFSPDFDLVEFLRLNPRKRVSAPGQPPSERSQTVERDARGGIHLGGTVGFTSEAEMRVDLVKGGAVEFDGCQIRWRCVNGPIFKASEGNREFFDAAQVGEHVVLRHWLPGDRFQPIGLGHSVKLQDFFTNQKVPKALRHRLVVAICADGEIFWVEGQRIGERFKLTRKAVVGLEWRWQRPATTINRLNAPLQGIG